MFGFSKLHIKPAVGGLNRFAYNPIHITTSDFGQLNTVYSRMLYPREKITINMHTFMRTELPLLKPTFGKVSVKNAAIAVPLKRIMMNSEGFFGNKPYSDGVASHSRTFTWLSFTESFLQGYTENVTDGSAYDFSFVGGNGTTYYTKLSSPRSRWMYKVLRSLGYDLPSVIDLRTTSESYRRLQRETLSALPLLAYLTAYLDCFYPRTKVNESPLSRLLYEIRMQSVPEVNIAQLFDFLETVSLYYGNSYLTSAWESPISPLDGQKPLSTVDNNIHNPTFNFDESQSYIEDGSVFRVLDNNAFINSRSVDYVNRITRWFKRNMLSGSRAYDSIRSQFGITPSAVKHDYSQILDVSAVPLKIGDVTQTSESNANSLLGDYAGKAIVDGSPSHFSFEATEHTFIIVFSWFSIEPFNWTGMKRDVFRVKPLDFYQPEFDGLDSQPILRAEVATDTRGGIGEYASPDDMSVFGFCNRYDDLRFDNDQITGDFSLNSIDVKFRECWHFGRRDMKSIVRYDFKAQSDNVLRVDGASYDNIFADFNTDADHFNAQYLFDITLMSPLQSFNEVAQLGVGDLTIERNGNQLS